MNLINKQLNADAQESTGTPEVTEPTTATTNPPVEEVAATPVATIAEPVVAESTPVTPVAESTPVTPVTESTPVAVEAIVTEPIQETIPATTEEVVVKPVVEIEEVAGPHDDFDWSIDKRNVSNYDDTQRKKYDKVYEETFVQINDGEILQGDIVGLTKTDAVINIGFKSDGLISLNEFRDVPGLKVGDFVEVMVVEKEDRDGNLHLSRKSARIYRAWERIMEVHKTGEVITGTVTS
jgi:small subunit ribosomal protein S1